MNSKRSCIEILVRFAITKPVRSTEKVTEKVLIEAIKSSHIKSFAS